MKARGKREAKRSASPLVKSPKPGEGLKGRNRRRLITPFQGWSLVLLCYQGRRAPLRFALAPGFNIPRLWRSY